MAGICHIFGSVALNLLGAVRRFVIASSGGSKDVK
jgi:hypothetical protein